jgi:SMODS and SLOG-associating 2TM effector domain 3/SMODS and SLOG-associating 2TM effector domain 1
MDLPALFSTADRASRRAQSFYLRLTAFMVFTLVLGAALAGISPANESLRVSLGVGSAVVIALSAVASIVIQTVKPERTWYGGRAVAESVKTVAWRYMMGAEPFELALSPAEAEARFIDHLQAITRERQQLAVAFSSAAVDRRQITPSMRSLRGEVLDVRRRTYLADRISDQRQWYGNGARKNAVSRTVYFASIFLSQAAAVLTAILLIVRPHSSILLTGFFATLAGALFGWTEVKRFRELSQSYAVAALDLSFIETAGLRALSQHAFAAFVSDAENAISREHTLWLARRDAA